MYSIILSTIIRLLSLTPTNTLASILKIYLHCMIKIIKPKKLYPQFTFYFVICVQQHIVNNISFRCPHLHVIPSFLLKNTLGRLCKHRSNLCLTKINLVMYLLLVCRKHFGNGLYVFYLFFPTIRIVLRHCVKQFYSVHFALRQRTK